MHEGSPWEALMVGEPRGALSQSQRGGAPTLDGSFSGVTPGVISTTFRPCGVTSGTARSVMMRLTRLAI